VTSENESHRAVRPRNATGRAQGGCWCWAVPAGPALSQSRSPALAIKSVAEQRITRCPSRTRALRLRAPVRLPLVRSERGCQPPVQCRAESADQLQLVHVRSRVQCAARGGHGARAVLRQGEREAGALVPRGGRAAAELRPAQRHRRQLDRPAAESR